MYAIIGTWEMAFESVRLAAEALRRGGDAGDAVEAAIRPIEDDPKYTSVGFGGLPGADGRVTCDAAYMDGTTLRMGGIMAAENVQNPICAARLLCGRDRNCLLAGAGAENFARESGLKMRDMRTDAALARWRERKGMDARVRSYDGHDTVCFLALDERGKLVAGVSTSGMFMKAPGRVGDSPLIGSGFYADALYGAAAATGLGEDIMRGCLSYEIVARMRRGENAAEACENAVRELSARKETMGEDAGEISAIALAPDGSFGAATALERFPFAFASDQLAAQMRDAARV